MTSRRSFVPLLLAVSMSLVVVPATLAADQLAAPSDRAPVTAPTTVSPAGSDVPASPTPAPTRTVPEITAYDAAREASAPAKRGGAETLGYLVGLALPVLLLVTLVRRARRR